MFAPVFQAQRRERTDGGLLRFEGQQNTGSAREFADMGVYDVQLVSAIKEHNVDGTRSLLEKISDIDFQTKPRRTALHAAVQHNNVVAAAMLLERGAGMNVLPMLKSAQTIRQCPMLQAFQMGESHEEMQLLFLRQLKVVRQTWSSASDQAIIATIPKYAMQYSTPLVFFDAIGDSGGASICNEGEIYGLSPLMHTLKEIALFSADLAQSAKTMENVFEMLDKYPAMAWERLKAPFEVPGLSLVYPEGATALGMLVFHSMPTRHKTDMDFVEMGENVLKMQAKMQPAMHSVHFVRQQTVEADRQKNVALVTYINAELIPKFFARMLRPMQVALVMANHARLGANEGCCAMGLSNDVIDIIFNGLVRTMVESPAVLEEMLC